MKKYISTPTICQEHHTSTNEILYWVRRFELKLIRQAGVLYVSSDDVELIVDALEAVRGEE
jgi:hypothetical protein